MEDAVQRLSAEIEREHWWHVGRRRVLRGVLKSLKLPPRARILDFGAGVGGNFSLLREFGSIVAVEPSLEAQRIAATTAPDVTYVSTLEDLPSNLAFDAAVMLDVLEHVDARPETLRAIGERVGLHAPLLVTVPAYPWLFGEHDRYLGHKLRYTRRSLCSDLDAGGFATTWLSSMNVATLPVAIAARLVETLRSTSGVERPASPRGMSIPPSPLNRALTAAFAAEALWPLPLPFGLSLVAVAKFRLKPGNDSRCRQGFAS